MRHVRVLHDYRFPQRTWYSPKREVRQLEVPLPAVVDHDWGAVAEVDLHPGRGLALHQRQDGFLAAKRGDDGLGTLDAHPDKLLLQILHELLHIRPAQLVRSRHGNWLAEHRDGSWAKQRGPSTGR